MSIDRKNADVNHQDHPHQEEQQNNTPLFTTLMVKEEATRKTNR